MKTLLDVHTHTVASGHAFSTLQEMAAAASEKGLKLLGITEHAPGIPGTCSGSPDKPGGLSIQLCKSEKKEFYIRYSS